MIEHRIAFVVPTKDRPNDLRNLLKSLDVQTVRPAQLIVVDGSEQPIRDVCLAFPQLSIEYVRHYPPSLAHQRNAGMARLRPDITLAGYLDDDLVLEPDAVERMLQFWKGTAADVGGARFNILNEPRPHLVWLKALFLIDHPRRGAALPSGFQTGICTTDHDLWVDWLSGGCTVWRKEVVDEFQFDEWFLDYGLLEDVEYSFRVGAKYRLAVVAAARCWHYPHPMKAEKLHHLGRWEMINRTYIVRKHKRFSRLLSRWSLFGNMLLNATRAVVLRDSNFLALARGNFIGFKEVLQGRIGRLGGQMR